MGADVAGQGGTVEEGGGSGGTLTSKRGTPSVVGGAGGFAGSSAQAGAGGKAAVGGTAGQAAGGSGGKPVLSQDCEGVQLDSNLPEAQAIYTQFPFDAVEAVRRQCEASAILKKPVVYALDVGEGVSVNLILLPAGKVTLGEFNLQVSGEKEGLHFLTAKRPFYYTQTQTTRAQYHAFMNADAVSDPKQLDYRFDASPKLPALEVYLRTRDLVLPSFQKKLPAGWKARIALGDEFEYAARAGTKTVWWTGDTEKDLAKIGWYNGNANGMLREVGQLLPNPWRIHDPVGNAWTWVCRTAEASCGELLYGAYLVRGGSVNEGAFDNGCRTANEQISLKAQGIRFVIELP